MMVQRIGLAIIFTVGCLAGSVLADEKEDRFFELYDIDGKLYRLKQISAAEEVSIVAVDFFWDGCKPCKKALPKWQKLYDRYHDKGLQVVIVDVRAGDDLSQARKKLKTYFRKHPVPFPVVFDKYNIVAREYGVVDEDNSVLLPQVFLLAKDGSLLLKTSKCKEAIDKVKVLLD